MEHKEGEPNFRDAVQMISDIFCRYTVEDIAESLFVSSLWLANIASPVQHQLLVSVFASLKTEQFVAGGRIATYEEFSEFLQSVYSLLPSFPVLEDYISDVDWGQIKFHHESNDFKIFYGTDLETVYDYLQSFQILFSSYDHEFSRLCGRSPDAELRISLSLQDRIISSISGQPDPDTLSDIGLGHKEIPPVAFWEEVTHFYAEFDTRKIADLQFLEEFSSEFGRSATSLSDKASFEAAAMDGHLLPYMFLRWQDRFFLMLPRRISEVLIDNWFAILGEYRKELCDANKEYSKHLTIEVYKYLRERIRDDQLFGLTNAVDSSQKPHEVVFSASLLAGDQLLMIYVAEPFTTTEDINKDLQLLAPKLSEAMELVGVAPVTLGLNIQQQLVRFERAGGGGNLKPRLLVVLPQATLLPLAIRLPSSLDAEIWSLSTFLAIFDEMETPSEFVEFDAYCKEIGDKITSPLTELLDIYASFRSSNGVLIRGAQTPNLIMLESHWGSNMRYDSLREFWCLYPEIGFIDHPRSWKPIRETASRVRLVARSYFGSALWVNIGGTKVFMTAPFENLTYEQGLVTDLLMQALEDYMYRLQHQFSEHPFFKRYERLQVVFLASKLSDHEKFKHIAHIKLNGDYWRSERGFPRADWPGIRVIFDADAVFHALQQAADNALEIQLLLEILDQINSFVPFDGFGKIAQAINSDKGKLPRFKAFSTEKNISFPEFIGVYKPEITDYKRARKRVAELAASMGIKAGDYELESAKEILNNLRKSVVREIDAEVQKFDAPSSIPYLIERIDALEDDHSKRRLSLQRSLEHEVDFERDENYSEEHADFLRHHRHFRYLIEKFVQLTPHGTQTLTRPTFQYLVALVERLHEIYVTSDNLYYQIYPVGITIDEDYIMEVKYAVDIDAMQESFGRFQARISLGEIGDKDDRVDTPGKLEEYLEDLDFAFKKDLGFELRHLVAVLTILSQWTGYKTDAKTSTHYRAPKRVLIDVCETNIMKLAPNEVQRILSFLSLRGSDVIRLTGQDEPCDDIPVWEYRKRKARYTIRPLIYLNREFCWGPYSAHRAEIMWTHVPLDHDLPADLACPTIYKALEAKHKLLEMAIEEKAFSIAKRHTSFAEKGVQLHNRDKGGKHPARLGDYDVIAFLPEKNTILNIECKEISPAFCAKDTRRMRERIFGRPGKEKGYLAKVEDRGLYLRENSEKVKKALGFPLGGLGNPEVVSLFVSRDMYWWMQHPARSTAVIFLRIDLLSEFIASLLK